MQQGKVSKDWARTADLMSQRAILQRGFFASYPDIFGGKQNDVKKQTNKKSPGMVAKFKREKKGKKGQLGQRERKIRRSTNKEALGEENSE